MVDSFADLLILLSSLQDLKYVRYYVRIYCWGVGVGMEG